MRSIKTNKIAVVWLLMVLFIRFGHGRGEQPSLQNYIDGEMYIVGGGYPKVGETFEIVYRIKVKELADWSQRKDFLTQDYCAVIHVPSEAAEIIGKDKFFFTGLTIGESKEFRTLCRILKPWNWIQVSGRIELVYQGKLHGPVALKVGIDIYLVDLQTGQYGTREEYEGKLPVEYRYDPLVGTFTCSSSQNPAPVEENKAIIKMIKQLEPTLSDSEALLLHSEQYKVGVPKGVSKWDEKNQRWTEEKIFEYYLKDGWFKALRENNLNKWEQREKTRINREWKEDGSLNFFRDRDNSYWDSTIDFCVAKTFYGHWHYKKHYYNKDQGLLGDAKRDTVKQCRARCLIRYTEGSNTYYSYFNQKCITNDSGYFFITINVNPNWTSCRVYPVLFPCGPDLNNPVIDVSDPNITVPDFWKDPDDPTLYIMREDGTGKIRPFTPDSNTLALGWVWTDTFPLYTQPHSGCINIYETYLHARTFMEPPPSWPLRVLWEPGYDTITKYNYDTIWVQGEPTLPIQNTDEWDDDKLLHEFGHYLMDYYAEEPPGYNPDHQWYLSDSAYKNTAYTEGWPTFFSGRARVNSGTDSLYVDNSYISGPVNLWRNIENPWLGSGYTPSAFQGGPWCEGSVCGVLWDIYDSYNEIPYPSYPDSLYGIWFPDTALADTLSMGFDPIWNVFDHYDPAGTPTNCWTVFHFRSGWNAFNYGHPVALNQILLHHRIRDSIPGAPQGLHLLLENSYARLYWRKNPEPDLQGYRIYRRERATVLQWSLWSVIGESADTTYLDTTVQFGYTYEYKLTSFDSLGNESKFSDSSRVTLPCLSNSSLATAYNNASRVVRNPLSGEIFLAYATEDNIRCISSFDEGFAWEGAVIAPGKFPALILDTTNSPCCIFSRWVVQAGEIGSAQVYWTKYLNNHWTTPYLLFIIDSIMGPSELKIPAPSTDIDSKDTVHITWITGLSKDQPHWFGVYYGNLYAGDINPVFNYTIIDTLSVYESPCPSLTVDNHDVIHVAYENGIGSPSIRYRYRQNGVWSEKPKPDTITQRSGCYYPDIESFGDRIYLVWDYQWPDTIIPHSVCSRIKTGLGWESIKTVYQPLPFYKFGEPVSAGGWYTIWANQDIYYSRFDGAAWGAPETVKVTPGLSVHPTALFRQDLNDTCLYIAWTEGDSAPYRIEFVKITVPAVPGFYADLGMAVPSQYCLYRDGYWVFGNKPYQTTDWGYENLRYKFTGLDPDKAYRLDVAYYFENNPKAEEIGEDDCSVRLQSDREDECEELNSGIEQERSACPERMRGDKPDRAKGIGRIIQAFVIDTIPLDTAFITPNKLVRRSVWLKKECYADDEIIIEIEKIKGKRVVCSEIGLYEFPEEAKPGIVGGPMGKETAILGRCLFERIYPNPAKNILKIRFRAPDNNCKVTIKLYDVSGRLVQKQDVLHPKIGANEILLAPEGLSCGIYFVYLETNNYQKIEKVIYLK